MALDLIDQSLLRDRAFVDGEWIGAEETFPIKNPANGEVIAQMARCGQREAALAINAAHKAQADWQAKTAKERSALIRRFFALIMENQEDLAYLLTTEQGKPLAEARGEVAYGANYLEWFAEEGKRVYGDTIPQPSNDKRIVCIKQPVGVVACITPWNFPSAMLARKLAPALAAGCTVVCKPANETPLSALALAELSQRAGIPNGVINMVCGKTGEIGQEFTSSPLVRKLTFTGSTAVGKKLIADCASTVKRTSMELGGNAPFIVFDDADIDAAVAAAIVCKFRNAGQTCVCANRIFVQEGVYDEFAEKFAAATGALKMGDGTQDGVVVGPMINEPAAENVLRMLESAVDNGAQIVSGGKRSDLGACFLEPTVVTNVGTNDRLFREEIFGPIAPLFKFKTEDEVIKLANETEYGLASYFFARDIGRIWRVSEALDYGMVGINEGILSNEAAPFGGVKESGQGREGSRYGLDDYLEIKYLCIGGIDK